MDKSGSWDTYPEIIDDAKLRPLGRVIVESSFNASMWALWGSCLVPVATALLWLAGFDAFFDLFGHGAAAREMASILGRSALVLLAVVGALVGWMAYNRLLHARRGARRKRPRLYPSTRLKGQFAVPSETLAKARQYDCLEAVLKDGRLRFFVPVRKVVPRQKIGGRKYEAFRSLSR